MLHSINKNIFVFLALSANPICYQRVYGHITLAPYWSFAEGFCFPLAGRIWKFYAGILGQWPIIRCLGLVHMWLQKNRINISYWRKSRINRKELIIFFILFLFNLKTCCASTGIDLSILADFLKSIFLKILFCLNGFPLHDIHKDAASECLRNCI